MENTPQFVGEHLGFGIAGRWFIILAFCSALLAGLGYLMATNSKDERGETWRMIGRWAYRFHGVMIFCAIGTLFIMLANRYFEYHYVWQHTNRVMPMRYILSSFWEGQEGSFLLWMFWHVVIGNILIFTAKKWESSVMASLSLVQAVLVTMVLGIYLGEYKIGSSPFTTLLRDHPDFMFQDIFNPASHHFDPNYTQAIDGRGLNPLLQNYWMTIHPPTLFLGFASTVVPFCYAIAGLWTKNLTGWLRPALPWTFFSVMILGTGILMGGAWAYEALSFGGFWAWDPVENASLVPWITLVGAAHLMLIFRNKGTSLYMLYILTFFSFLLVLYSTFLTRSGVLGDTSVHAFTDLGMNFQLLIFLLGFVCMAFSMLMQNRMYRLLYVGISVLLLLLWALADVNFAVVLPLFFVISLVMLVMSYLRFFPRSSEEEAFFSREFWMFVGALVLLVSAFQISGYTSIPVINKFTPSLTWLWELLHPWALGDEAFSKLSSGTIAPKSDAEAFHQWQIPIAIVVALLMAMGQFLRYRKTNMREFGTKMLAPLVATGGIGTAILFAFDMSNVWYITMMYATLFSVIANLDYAISVVKGKIKKAGSSIAHIGFGLILLGALISTSQQKVISQNSSGIDVSPLGESMDNEQNVLMFIGDTLPMDDYYITYSAKRTEGVNVFFEVNYLKRNEQGKLASEFTLEPFVQLNERMGNVAEPGTKHFWTKDIYTHLKYAEVTEREGSDTWDEPQPHKMHIGDTLSGTRSIFVLDSVTRLPNMAAFGLDTTHLGVMAHLRVSTLETRNMPVTPVFVLKGNTIFSIPDTAEAGPVFSFDLINPQTAEHVITVTERKNREFIVMEAIVFPWINVLWLGCFLLIIGSVLAIIHRIQLSLRKSWKKQSPSLAAEMSPDTSETP